MDVASLASALIAARLGQAQVAAAMQMMRMNAEAQAAVVQMIEAAQVAVDPLANVAAGVGGTVDVTV